MQDLLMCLLIKVLNPFKCDKMKVSTVKQKKIFSGRMSENGRNSIKICEFRPIFEIRLEIIFFVFKLILNPFDILGVDFNQKY